MNLNKDCEVIKGYKMDTIFVLLTIQVFSTCIQISQSLYGFMTGLY